MGEPAMARAGEGCWEAWEAWGRSHRAEATSQESDSPEAVQKRPQGAAGRFLPLPPENQSPAPTSSRLPASPGLAPPPAHRPVLPHCRGSSPASPPPSSSGGSKPSVRGPLGPHPTCKASIKA